VVGLRRLAAAALLTQLLLGTVALPASAATVPASSQAPTGPTKLIEVVPGNGATVTAPPPEAALTFSNPLDPARSTATVTAPGQDARDAAVRVDGAVLNVQLPSEGPGSYVVSYAVAPAGAAQGTEQVRGGVGFTVAADGVAAETGGGLTWAVASAVAVLGLVLVVAWTVRRFQDLR
jgi:methionine-rich copper-binding protein CopC